MINWTTTCNRLKYRYECEEDEFLRELECMRGQLPDATSLCDEVPILGMFVEFSFFFAKYIYFKLIVTIIFPWK